MSVDVEDYFHVGAFSKCIDRSAWESLPSRVEANTFRLLELFDTKSVTATFFVLGWVAQRFPEVIKEIQRHGHEIASHGLSHQLIYQQSQEEFRHETLASKHLLEDLIGEEVIGYRAASFSITKKSLWALDIIAEAGFRYDSSISPVRHDLYGIPDAKPELHVLRTDSGHGLTEFPPTTVRLLGTNVPAGGGGYFRIYPYWLSSGFLRSVARRSAKPFMFYVHPWEIDPEQPRIRAGFKSRFRHYYNLNKTEARLSRLFDDFDFGTVRDVLADAGHLTRPSSG